MFFFFSPSWSAVFTEYERTVLGDLTVLWTEYATLFLLGINSNRANAGAGARCSVSVTISIHLHRIFDYDWISVAQL